MTPQVLTVDEIREFVSDYAPNNYLLDGEEFTDTFITLCMSLGVDSFNAMTPMTYTSLGNFPSKTVLLYATVWQMYNGKALLLARNTLNYSDGGVQIPVEERAQMYQGLADSFRNQFRELAQPLKIQMNMASGWGEVRSDYATFSYW